MPKSMRFLMLSILAASLPAMLACSGEKNQPANTQVNTDTPTRAIEKKSKATGSITANPNPIRVCDGTGTGVTALTWSASGTTKVEARIGSPDGGLFAHTGPDGGTKKTGRWVSDGMIIYLQDVSDGRPLTSDNTIGTLTLKVTTAGCP